MATQKSNQALAALGWEVQTVCSSRTSDVNTVAVASSGVKAVFICAHATRVHRIHQRRLVKTPVTVGGAADAGKREEASLKDGELGGKRAETPKRRALADVCTF